MNRLQRIQKDVLLNTTQAFFVKSEQNITYLTGFKGDASRLIVTSTQAFLLTDGRYTEQALHECVAGVEVVNWIDDLRYQHTTYQKVLEETGISSLYFEGDSITFTEYQELKLCSLVQLQSITGSIEALRCIKGEDEIGSLREAGRISDYALHQVLPFIRPGMTELDLVAELEYQLKKNGAHHFSFDTMVLFGDHSSLLHGQSGGRQLQNGEHILFDFGAKYQGYHADISRVVVLGEANAKQKEIYAIVNNAGMQAAEMLMDGVTIKAIDAKVRSAIPDNYLKYFYPGIGHGVGLEVHELPFIKQGAIADIREHMVITIEPGLYIPGWGGMRVEDSILIKQSSCETLNTFPRTLIEL